MKTETTSTFLERILDKLRPADLQLSEHRLALKARVDHLIVETGLGPKEFGARIRSEMTALRTWLAGTRDLTIETLTEFCLMLNITLGDLVVE